MNGSSSHFKIRKEELSLQGLPQPIRVPTEGAVIDCCPDLLTAIQIRDLHVRYGSRIALQAVTASIPRQAITAVIGPSGCGKSTFLACLNRLIHLQPSVKVSGHIFLESMPLHEIDDQTLRRKVGMVFQKPAPFPISIWKNLALPLRELPRVSGPEINRRIEDALRSVGLWEEVKDRLNDSALRLSGGQQQRLCIARALVLQPDVLLLDEPCSALDPQSSEVVEKLIVSLAERYTIVIVTHNLAQARRIADRALLFWVIEGQGTVVEQGRMDDLVNCPRSQVTAEYLCGIRG